MQPGKRAAILTAVWGLIAERGIAEVSFRNVAQRADVSLGLVQHYFGSKEQLVRASAEAMIESAARWHRSEDMAPRAALRRVLAHQIPTSAAARRGVAAWYSYVAASFSDAKLAELLADAKRGQQGEAAGLVARLRPGADASEIARRLIAISDGLTLRVLGHDLSATDAVRSLDLALDDQLDEHLDEHLDGVRGGQVDQSPAS